MTPIRMRVPFSDIFEEKDGTTIVKQPIQVGSATIYTGKISGTVTINSINLENLKGKEFEVERQGNILVLHGYYK